MVDALFKKYILLSTLNMKLLRFEYMKDLYENNSDFSNVYNVYEKLAYSKFYRLDEYLFRENKLYMLDSSLCELLLRKAHDDSLMEHFGVRKTSEILHKHFYWSKIKHYVQRVCNKCITYRRYKSKILLHDLYTLLPLPNEP